MVTGWRNVFNIFTDSWLKKIVQRKPRCALRFSTSSRYSKDSLMCASNIWFTIPPPGGDRPSPPCTIPPTEMHMPYDPTHGLAQIDFRPWNCTIPSLNPTDYHSPLPVHGISLFLLLQRSGFILRSRKYISIYNTRH